MKRAIKFPESKIVSEDLNYIIGNYNNNNKIAQILLAEQKSLCAYTDEYIGRADARDIEHFNPHFKGSQSDGYNNWFLVKHQWNKEKSDKWLKFQPILHPTAPDFEDRIVYSNGDYFAGSDSDTEAKNLVNLLQLDDPELADLRKKYIKRKKDEIYTAGQDAETFFSILIKEYICGISYSRAIKEEFGLDIWGMLS